MGIDPGILNMLGGMGGLGNMGKTGGPDLSQLANLASLAGSMKPGGRRAKAGAATDEGDPIIDVDPPGAGAKAAAGLDMGTLMSVLSMMGSMAPPPPAQPPPEPEPQPQPQPPGGYQASAWPDDPCRDCREFCPRSGLALPDYAEARRRAEVCCRF